MTADGRILPVILSGGAGTRLWPLSRPENPKQLHRLGSEVTLLQAAALRASDPALFAPPLVIGGGALADAVEAQLAKCGVAPSAMILEPQGRNTAAAIALAALEVDAGALLLIMPSDHLIADVEAFRAAVRRGMAAANDGWLVTFGIQPERAETGYGDIERAEEIAPGVHRARRFVEKPDRATAQAYIAGGAYDWNGGIFLARAVTLRKAFTSHAPDILDQVQAAIAAGRRDGNRVSPDPASFATVRSESIDIAVMEKAERVAVVPVRMGWSDVGSWDALYEAGRRDAAANVVSGDALAIDTTASLLASEGPRIVAIGVEDLIVVATADAVLVVPRGQSQRVKEAVERLNGGTMPPRHDV